MKTLSISLLSLSLSLLALSEASKPNIIFLMADDLGFGDVGFNGNELIQTPHLGRMAVDGIKFTRF
jgi:arylsulfatase A-like enzyme